MEGAVKSFPELPLEKWEPTKNTLHLFLQVVGKIRLYTFPPMNHWWHAPLYVNPRGLTTRPIPYRDRQFEISFDFFDHQLHLQASDGRQRTFSLQDKSVAQFTKALFVQLSNLDIEVSLKRPAAYDVPFADKPFEQITEHNSYQPEQVQRYFQVLSQVDSVFQIFRGRFIGKSTPPHLFWHHMDLALTRFSGKPAPVRKGASRVEREAYSHEVISFGFWAGDDKVRAPAFYAYAAPALPKVFEQPIAPAAAAWNKDAGMALLMYDDIRKDEDPRQRILEFLESTYQACAEQADWNLSALTFQSA
jgi:hypothetical protein